MKKIAKRNFILIFILVLIITVECIFAHSWVNGGMEVVNGWYKDIEERIEKENSKDGVDDVVGIGLIFQSAAVGLSAFGGILVEIVLVALPACYGIVLFILLCIASFGFGRLKSKMIGYKIVMGVCLLYILAGIYFGISLLRIDLPMLIQVILYVYVAYSLFAVIYGAINTYKGKNMQENKEMEEYARWY